MIKKNLNKYISKVLKNMFKNFEIKFVKLKKYFSLQYAQKKSEHILS